MSSRRAVASSVILIPGIVSPERTASSTARTTGFRAACCAACFASKMLASQSCIQYPSWGSNPQQHVAQVMWPTQLQSWAPPYSRLNMQRSHVPSRPSHSHLRTCSANGPNSSTCRIHPRTPYWASARAVSWRPLARHKLNKCHCESIVWPRSS